MTLLYLVYNVASAFIFLFRLSDLFIATLKLSGRGGLSCRQFNLVATFFEYSGLLKALKSLHIIWAFNCVIYNAQLFYLPESMQPF